MSDYDWRAYYKDKSALESKRDGKEVLFEEIDQDNLRLFQLIMHGICVEVNLEDGTLFIDGHKLLFPYSNRDLNYRLIYFRRNTHMLGSNEVINHKVKHFIGYQVTVDGENHKVMLGIDPKKFTYEIIQK